MPRINLEDKIYRDARFDRFRQFCASRAEAIGYCVLAWTLAQEWISKSPHGTIPMAAWDDQGIPESFISAGLAEIQESGIYVKGSREQFEWLIKRKEAARIGGLKTQGKISSNGKAKSSKRKQTQPSSSSSFSFSEKKENTIAGFAIRRDRIEEIYKNHYPRKDGKTAGMKKLSREIISDADLTLLEAAVKNYAKQVAGYEQKFIKHWGTFAGCWRDYLPDATPTGPKVELTPFGPMVYVKSKYATDGSNGNS